MRPVFALTLLFAALLLIRTAASAEDWPEGYVVHPDSESPDHQFAILIPGSEPEYSDKGIPDEANYLANIKTHQLLGKIADADYYENQNHRHLSVTWSADSKACVAEYEGRFGYDTISVLQLNGSSFQQTDLGKHIEKALSAVVGEEGTGDAWFRFAPNNKLLVRGLYYTGNPKLMDENTKQARFAGTFDLVSKKWITSEAHKTKDWDALSEIYTNPGPIFVAPNGDESKVPDVVGAAIVPSEEKKAEALDEDMNRVYKNLRAVLPAARFAKLHQEQMAWLKKRDAAQSLEEKSKLIEGRTKALRDVVWSQ